MYKMKNFFMLYANEYIFCLLTNTYNGKLWKFLYSHGYDLCMKKNSSQSTVAFFYKIHRKNFATLMIDFYKNSV